MKPETLSVTLRALLARMDRAGTKVKSVYGRNRDRRRFEISGILYNLEDLEVVARKSGQLKPFERVEE
jgi:hypothetical protein